MDKELVTCRKNLLVAKEKSQTFSNQLKSSRSQMQDAQSQKSRYIIHIHMTVIAILLFILSV